MNASGFPELIAPQSAYVGLRATPSKASITQPSALLLTTTWDVDPSFAKESIITSVQYRTCCLVTSTSQIGPSFDVLSRHTLWFGFELVTRFGVLSTRICNTHLFQQDCLLGQEILLAQLPLFL